MGVTRKVACDQSWVRALGQDPDHRLHDAGLGQLALEIPQLLIADLLDEEAPTHVWALLHFQARKMRRESLTFELSF